MQRVGFLYFVCRAALPNRPTTLQNLADRFYDSVRRLEKVDFSAYEEYFNRHRLLSQRYKGQVVPAEIEYQDMLLGDSEIASSTGAVTEKAYTDIVDEANYWHLVRDKSYTLTGRGACMIDLWEGDGSSRNPLILNTASKVAASFWYIDVDGDALRVAYKHLVPGEFERENLGYAIASGIDDLLKDRRPAFVSERALFQRLKELAINIRTQGGDTVGTGRARFQAATPRAEHLVDLGWLEKTDAYKYRLSPSGLPKAIPDDIDAFLDRGFGRCVADTLGLSIRESSNSERWGLFLQAYRKTRNALGYASFREAVVLAQASGIAEGVHLEQADIRETVLNRRDGNRIRFAVGRDGKPDNVKVDNV